MISDHSATRKWLQHVMNTYRRSDPGIIEKTIMALTLLEQLAIENLQFVFKGGTSLILLLQRFNRFSLDIDILLRQRPTDLETSFDRICERGVFKHCQARQTRSRSDCFPGHLRYSTDRRLVAGRQTNSIRAKYYGHPIQGWKRDRDNQITL